MAILNAENTHNPQPSPPPEPSNRRGFFLRSLVPRTAVNCSISLSLFPPHALTRHSFQPHLSSTRQLVTSQSTSLSVYSVDQPTESLLLLTRTQLFVPVIALASLPSPIPSRDILLALTSNAKVAFLRYDDHSNLLSITGDVALPHPAACMLATHPTRPLVAVPTLTHSLTVFPLLFLPKTIAAGKLTTVQLSGTPLSLTFLHDDNSPEAVLLVLEQYGEAQVLTLFTVTPTPDGLSVVKTASMIPCSTRPDDRAVARAEAKLTGEPPKPSPKATAITRLPGCPYMFAVFVDGKVVAADAKPVLRGMLDGKPGPVAVRLDEEEQVHDHTARLKNLLSSPLTTAQRDVVRLPDVMAAAQTPEMGVSDIPMFPITQGRVISFVHDSEGGRRRRRPRDDYVSYLSVPAHITLGVEQEDGNVTAWTDARDHFRDNHGDGNGVYFAMQGGGLYVLRWSEIVQAGTTSFRVPVNEQVTHPRTTFRVQYIGDVGPARSIAALCGGLIFVANDCADGSLRKISMPSLDMQAILMAGLHDTLRKRGLITPQDRRFGLEVRQEFLNLAPISDFVIIPPSKESSFREREIDEDSDENEPRELMDQTVDLEKHRDNFQRRRRGEPSVNHRTFKTDRRAHQRNLWVNGPHSTPDLHVEEGVQAASHVLDGSGAESEIVVCSGFGRFGSVRLIRPGAPVSIFASSARTFSACNDMFPIRFTTNSPYHAGLALTFAQRTGVLYSIPLVGRDKARREEEAPAIANLVDGTEATGLISYARTLSISALQDGILAQIHERGIRLIFLKAAADFHSHRRIEAGELKESLYERVVDWSPPDGEFISVGTIGAGFVMVCIIQKGGQGPLLLLLKLHPRDPRKGLVLVSSDVLEQELSIISIPEGTATRSNQDALSPEFPPVAILGTYKPSIEIRLLGPSMEILDQRVTSPWGLDIPSKMGSAGNSLVGQGNSDASDAEHSDGVQESEALDKVFPSFAVPESICALEVGKRRLLFAGLRDGSVICYSYGAMECIESADQGSPSVIGGLILESHRKLGHRPVVLKLAKVAIGMIVLAQAERPWMCTLAGGGNMRWYPLSFTETSAICAYSILGAERCIAMVGEDSALHICGIRRATEVSIRSIHIGSTPRRVVPVSHPKDSIVVATTMEKANVSSPPLQNQYSSAAAWMSSGARFSDPSIYRTVNAELRVYSRKHGVKTGITKLLPGEQVHVLLSWLGFIVVGTSEARTDQGPVHPRTCKRGRLRLFSLHSKGGPAVDSSESPQRTKLTLCSEVVLPGAVLAGAGHPSYKTANILIVSCNEEVIVFGVSKSRRVLVEITRTSTRSLVVGISIFDNMVCVSDRKDSIGFYSLKHVFATEELLRDRTDHRRRIISDAVMVDNSLAFAVDRMGIFFSIGYEDGDGPDVPPERAQDRLEFRRLLERCESYAAAQDAETIDESVYDDDSFQICFGNPVASQLNASIPNVGNGSSVQGTVQATQITIHGDGMAEAHQLQVGGDHVMVAGSADSQDEISSGPGDGADGVEDAGTNTPNQTQATDDLVPEEAVPSPDIGNNTGNIAGSGAGRNDSERVHLPKNLACHHNFNLADTSLRMRYGAFNRSERTRELEARKRRTSACSNSAQSEFFQEATSAVFCGTLGGAMIAAVPVCGATFALLSQVEAELSVHPNISGPALGKSHESFRAAYSSRPEGILDGDLLDHFDALNREDKLEICKRAGYPGEKGMLHVEALIRDLFDRVS